MGRERKAVRSLLHLLDHWFGLSPEGGIGNEKRAKLSNSICELDLSGDTNPSAS